jgi:hypothetical protein
MARNVTTAAAALFLIMIAPGVGFFVEGDITVTSCLCSVVAFFLLIREIFLGQSQADHSS